MTTSSRCILSASPASLRLALAPPARSCASAANAAERASATRRFKFAPSGRPRSTTSAWWFSDANTSRACARVAAAFPPLRPKRRSAAIRASALGAGGSFAPSRKTPWPPYRAPYPSGARPFSAEEKASPSDSPRVGPEPKSSASTATFTAAATPASRSRRSRWLGSRRANRARSAASSSPCGGAPARAALKYSERRNLVQNSRSVIFAGTLFRNARRTAGRSLKILCIFSLLSVAVTTSERPSLVPLMSASSAFATPGR